MQLEQKQKMGVLTGVSIGLYIGVWTSVELTDCVYDYDWLSMDSEGWANHVSATASMVLVPLCMLVGAGAGFTAASMSTPSKYSLSCRNFSFHGLWKSVDSALEGFVSSSASVNDDQNGYKMA